MVLCVHSCIIEKHSIYGSFQPISDTNLTCINIKCILINYCSIPDQSKKSKLKYDIGYLYESLILDLDSYGYVIQANFVFMILIKASNRTKYKTLGSQFTVHEIPSFIRKNPDFKLDFIWKMHATCIFVAFLFSLQRKFTVYQTCMNNYLSMGIKSYCALTYIL